MILAIFFVVWIFTDLDYDAKEDQESMGRMFAWSPLSTAWCMDSIAIAANNPRLSNLDGKNCPQIYNLALTRIQSHYAKEVEIFSNGLEASRKQPGSRIEITYIPLSGAEMSIYNENAPSVEKRIYSQEQLIEGLNIAQSNHAKISAEIDGFFTKMPWSKKIRFGNITHTPTRFKIIDGLAQNITAKTNQPYPTPNLAFDKIDLLNTMKRSGMEQIWISDFTTYLSSPDKYWQECIAKEASTAQISGGMEQGEAQAYGQNACQNLTQKYYSCLNGQKLDDAVLCLQKHINDVAQSGE